MLDLDSLFQNLSDSTSHRFVSIEHLEMLSRSRLGRPTVLLRVVYNLLVADADGRYPVFGANFMIRDASKPGLDLVGVTLEEDLHEVLVSPTPSAIFAIVLR